MSGGSFSYICFFNVEPDHYLQELKSMVDYARTHEGYSQEVADVLEAHLVIMQARWRSMQARHEVVQQLMKAVEWECSCDSSADSVNEALARLLGDSE